MNQSRAEQWVVVSAAVVGGAYALQRYKGVTKTTLGEFGTAWGVVFFTLALITTASPEAGGALAILIMVGDLLVNVPSLAKLTQSSAPSKPSPSSPATPSNKGNTGARG